jgi:hypothetical protein
VDLYLNIQFYFILVNAMHVCVQVGAKGKVMRKERFVQYSDNCIVGTRTRSISGGSSQRAMPQRRKRRHSTQSPDRVRVSDS